MQCYLTYRTLSRQDFHWWYGSMMAMYRSSKTGRGSVKRRVGLGGHEAGGRLVKSRYVFCYDL